MRLRYWLIAFILFGLFGAFFEMLIGLSMNIVYQPYFYIYYNGFTTSIESYFLFGLFGCFGLRLVFTKFKLVRKNEWQ